MIFDESQDFFLSLDPFWLENQGQIRLVKRTIEAPKTRVGKEILKDALNNTIFRVYNRLNPVLGSLMALLEYDEIFKAEARNYFSEPKNQRMVLKALGIIVESEIKVGYLPEERKKYTDYLPFLEGVLFRFHQYEEQIQAGTGQPVNIVNSLIVIASQEISKLKGVRNFGVGIEGIRRKIEDFLPVLKKIEEGRIFMEIKDQMTDALSPDVKVKKVP